MKRSVPVPVSLLMAPNLSPADKVVWLSGRLFERPASQPQLAETSHLHLTTIGRSLRQLRGSGWNQAVTGPVVEVPRALLCEPLHPWAKLLYGLLQVWGARRNAPIALTYAAIAAAASISVTTARDRIRELAASRWIAVTQANQNSPLCITLRDLTCEQGEAEAADAERRILMARYRGETIMKEWLSNATVGVGPLLYRPRGV